MTIPKSLKAVIDSLKPENTEEKYGAFYPAVQGMEISTDEMISSLRYVKSKVCEHTAREITAYGPLLLGALIDKGVLPKSSEAISEEIVPDFLNSIDAITDFEVLNADAQYIHHLSHVGYLGISLCDANLLSSSEASQALKAIVAAYLRSDLVLYYNEPMVIGELILKLCKIEPMMFPAILELLLIDPNRSKSVIRTANITNLRLAMFALNTKLKNVQPDDAPLLIESILVSHLA